LPINNHRVFPKGTKIGLKFRR